MKTIIIVLCSISIISAIISIVFCFKATQGIKKMKRLSDKNGWRIK